MKEFKGTKSKWKFTISEARIKFSNPEMDLWCKTKDNEFNQSKEEQINNAKLIRSAPELLESVQFFLDTFEPEKDWMREEFDKAKKLVKEILD